MTTLGYGPEFQKASCKSPFRHEKTPSFGVFRTKDGDLKWRDFTTGVSGDQIDFLAEHLDCSSKEAIVPFFKMAMPNGFPEDDFNGHRHGNGNGAKYAAGSHRKPQSPPRPQAPVPEPESPTALRPFAWAACVKALTQEHIDAIIAKRGYAPEFVAWLKAKELLGIYRGFPATPVETNGVVVGCQFKGAEGPRFANFTPGAKTPAELLVVGDPTTSVLTVAESPWDGFALLERLGAHQGNTDLCMAMTRGASNHARLKPVFEARAASTAVKDVLILGQNDKPHADGTKTGHQTLEDGVAKLAMQTRLSVRVVFPPAHIKDFCDYTLADPTLDVFEFLDGNKLARKSVFSADKMFDIWKEPDCPEDNYFGDNMISAGQALSILAAAGTGKSRISLQLAFCMILGLPFLNMPTLAKGKKWLIVQTENSNKRLKSDTQKLCKGLKLTQEEMQYVNERLIFHTIRNAKDCWINLDTQEDRDELALLIDEHQPDFVVFDPLNTFSSEDINSDASMKQLCMFNSQVVMRANPKCVPIVIHHALTGMAGAAKVTGWDKGSFGRNSKALNAWNRSQFNIAVRDPEDDSKLIVACGKNNNGKSFPPIGVIFDEELWLYVVDESFDLKEFQEAVSGAKAGPGRAAKVHDFGPMLDALDDQSLPKGKLLELLQKHDPKLEERTGFRLINAAEESNVISVT